MSEELRNLRFVVKPLPAQGVRPNDMATSTMRVHPLTYLELDHDPEYTLYNHRLTPARLNNATADEMYWKVRREVVLRNTGELPIEIKGPDAEALLNCVFTREVSKVRTGRCSYQFACYHDGGMITDGVLLRLDDARFWMTQADGDIFSWYKGTQLASKSRCSTRRYGSVRSRAHVPWMSWGKWSTGPIRSLSGTSTWRRPRLQVSR